MAAKSLKSSYKYFKAKNEFKGKKEREDKIAKAKK
jgi:hypothetical protein